MNENAPFGFFRLFSLYTLGRQKVCIFFTLVLAMMFDGFFATQQIHREEQALEIKKQFLLGFSELIPPTTEHTVHELCARADDGPSGGAGVLLPVPLLDSLVLASLAFSFRTEGTSHNGYLLQVPSQGSSVQRTLQ